MKIKSYLKGIGLWVITLTIILSPMLVCADCEIVGTIDGGYLVSCTGMETDGFCIGDGNDILTVELDVDDPTIVSNTIQQWVEAIASANAIAIDAGGGNNQVTNYGSVGATAEANALPEDGSPSQATATATAVKTGDNLDVIKNFSTITSTATSNSESGAISMVPDLSDLFFSATSEATAKGVDAGSDGDQIVNSGTINAAAEANANLTDILVPPLGSKTLALPPRATAHSTGIEGGAGNDEITNSGTVYATAVSDSESVDISLALDLEGGATSEATAVGINANEGDDQITNTAAINAEAEATARSDAVVLNLNVLSIGTSATPTTATASSTGIDGGTGNDSMTNNGTITANAESDAYTGSGTVSILQYEATVLGEAQTESKALVKGIAAGAGDDTATNTGTIVATANASALTLDISVEVLGDAKYNASTTSSAIAVGIEGGAGNDGISNTGTINMNPITAVSISTAVDVKMFNIPTAIGEFFGTELGDARTAAEAEATGIAGETGDDTISNTGTIDIYALSDADSNSVETTLSITASPKASASGTGVQSSSLVASGATAAPLTAAAAQESEADSDIVDTSTTALAFVTGIDAGADMDTVTNAGKVIVKGESDADSVTVSPSINISKGSILNILPGMALAETSTRAKTEVTGIDGGAGNDTLKNENAGEVSVEAFSNSTSADVAVLLKEVTTKGLAWGGAISKAKTEAIAIAAGIAGAEDNDTIENSGTIKVTAKPDADSASIIATLMGAKEGLVAGFTYVEASTTAEGTATGIAGGADNDTIKNTSTGEIEVTSEPTSTSAHVGVTLEGAFSQEWSAVLGGAMTDGTTKAISNATGIAGDEGEGEITSEGDVEIADESYYEITNEGKITVKALPDADSASVSVTLTGGGDGLTAGFTYADSTTTAEANAAGISGGPSNEIINNTSTGQINVTAQPTSSSASVGVTLTGVVKGTGIVGGAALTDGTTKAIANIAGIKGGEGNDMITNEGVITVNSTSPDIADEDAESGADSASVSVDLGGAFGELGFVGGFTYANAETTADATTVGIDGGKGNDTIKNLSTGQINVTSQPTSSSASVGVTAKGVTGLGAAVGASLTDGTTKAISTATGIDGGGGEDKITNDGTITVKALPDADSGSVSVTLSAAKEGVAVGGTFADATTTAQGTAAGIAGGEGQDEIFNTGPIAVTAHSESSSASVSVSAEGTMTGAALGVALADGTTKAISTAAGIESKGGSDNIESDNVITVDSISDVDAASVSVNLGGAETGLVAGVAAADITTTAESTASGISSGTGDDTVGNWGSTTVTATSTNSSAGVSVQGGYASTGLAAGAALADGRTVATSTAVGVEGGDGNDTVTNYGWYDVNATSDVTGASVAVTLAATEVGLAGGASFVDGENWANASAIGISGGSGDDTIRADFGGELGGAHVTATTTSTRTNVSVTGSLSLKGAAAGASFADASNVATAEAISIEGGEGNDEITNSSYLRSDGSTTANTKSVAVNVNVAVGPSVGFSGATATTTSTHSAKGISGGEGDDRIRNLGGVIESASTANAKAKSITVDIAVASFGKADVTTTANASALGIDGAGGQDDIENTGVINLTATSDVDATAGLVTLAGIGDSNAKGFADALVTGIDTGHGENKVVNAGLISGTATVTADAISYDVTLGGGGTVAAGTEATATAVGIAGGGDSDLLQNEGTISLSSSSTVVSDSQSYEFVGVGIADADSKAQAFTTGIDGGEGRNEIFNNQTGLIDVSAAASATATDMSASFGITAASASTTANAFSTGLRSGNNDDLILNEGSLNVNATTSTAAGTGQFSILGLAVGDALTEASANGINAGGGNDVVINEGSITVGGVEDNDNPMAYAEVANATFSFTSISITAFEADAQATGVLGGSGDDSILNSGTIAVGDDDWMAKSYGYGFTGEFFQILGLTSVATRADSVSLGIAGGAGDDVLVNDADGVLTVKAASYSEAEGAGDTSFGNEAVVASSTAAATATGISGGAGLDLIENKGKIDSYAHSFADAYAIAFVGWGEPEAEAKTDATATATGITAESGQNQIANSASISVTSLAETQIYAKGDSNVDDTNSKATSQARSTALGILGGNDGNFVTNTGVGKITVTATALTMARANEKDEDGGEPIEAAAVSDEYATDTAGSAKDPITAIAKGISLGSGDDTIINAGLVEVDAQSNAESSALSDSSPYKAKSVSNAYGKAEAWGIVVGEGSNWVENSKQLDISAVADASAEANSYSGLSTSETEANSDAKASATGVQGDGEIMNLKDGSIAVKAQATTSAITGYTIEEESEDTIATAKLTSTATGITTASDNTRPEPDRISNEGSISVEAVTGDDSNGYAAYAWVDTDSRHNEGTAKGSSGVDAAGIRVGNNSAEITNTGDLIVIGKARVRVFAHSDSGSVAVIGVDENTVVQADVTGIEAGNGNNTVTNSRSINVESEANTYSKSEASDAEVTTSSTTQAGGSSVATGIKVGNGDNTVKNYDDLEVTAKSNATALSTYDEAHLDNAFAYAGKKDTLLTSNAFGISAGSGRNFIDNYSSMIIRSFVTADSDAKSNTSAAETNSEASAGGQAQAVGITSGGGQNFIKNYRDSIINVTASASGDATGDADEKATANAGSEDDPITAIAKGISLGSGDDTIINAGLVEADAQSNATSNASSDSSPYKAKSVSNAYGKADAWGVVAGEGSNWVENSGLLDISALADANTKADSYSEWQTSSTEANSGAPASATGVQGNGEITNFKDGSIAVRAQATTSAKTGSTEEESEDTTATAKLTATATGITTASDSNRAEPDRIRNEGSISVEAVTGEDSFTPLPTENEYAAYAWVDTDDRDNKATAKASSDVDATGIRVGNNSAEITNTGDLIVIGQARVRVFAHSDTGSDAVIGVDDDTAVQADVTGIEAGNGNNTVTNSRSIIVESEVSTWSFSEASDEEVYTSSTTQAGGSSVAIGIKVGDGDNTVKNYYGLEVTAKNNATALSTYDAAHLDDAFAYAGTKDASLTSKAVGISSGDGFNVIENYKSMTVESSVTAFTQAFSNTSYADTRTESYAGGQAQAIGINGGDGENRITNYQNSSITVYSEAKATAYGYAEEVAEAEAYARVGSASDPGAIAISVGNGVNEIVNDGRLSATARADSDATAFAGDHSSADAVSYATATGIRTGDGDNKIVNNGELTVNSRADSEAMALHSTTTVTIVEAIGIQTGNGNDLIINDGIILTRAIKNGVSSSGMAISSGAGNDQVLLKDASQSDGQINLGDGDDWLTMMGAPLVTGEVTGAVGIDTLVFDGPGSIGFTPVAFENAVKQGAGTYVVANLPTMQRIEVNQGTLEINNDHAMANDSTFQTNVNGDGNHGQLKVNGTGRLAGDLKVIKGPGPYTNGTTYDVMEADTLNGLFSNVMLPAPTPLLSFEMNQLPNIVEIETSAKNFTTVANNRVHWIIADYLDRVMPLADGDLSYVLGEIQNLSEPEEFDTGFSSLSPDPYDNFTRATLGSTWQYIKSLRQRMNTVRSYSSTVGSDLQTKPILLAYSGLDASLGQFFTPGQLSQVQGKNGLWFNAYGQWGDQDEGDGFTGFDYDLWGTTLGFDYTFSDKLMAGLSLGYSGTDIDLDGHLGDGDIGSLFGSLYGSYFNKNAYIEAAFSYGRNWYENSRLVRVGPIQRRASSEHDGDAFSGYLGAGYYFNLKDWALLGPFGSLRYIYLDEESFRETGADSVSLWVESRETDSLVSELGVQVTRAFGTKYGTLIPELSAAWSYDFDIDDRVITTSFAGSPGAEFSMEGRDVEKHGAILGAGLTFIHQSGFSTSLRYSGEFRKDYASHGVIGELRYTF